MIRWVTPRRRRTAVCPSAALARCPTNLSQRAGPAGRAAESVGQRLRAVVYKWAAGCGSECSKAPEYKSPAPGPVNCRRTESDRLCPGGNAPVPAQGRGGAARPSKLHALVGAARTAAALAAGPGPAASRADRPARASLVFVVGRADRRLQLGVPLPAPGPGRRHALRCPAAGPRLERRRRAAAAFNSGTAFKSGAARWRHRVCSTPTAPSQGQVMASHGQVTARPRPDHDWIKARRGAESRASGWRRGGLARAAAAKGRRATTCSPSPPGPS